VQTVELIADLEKGLAAAKKLAAQGGEPADTSPESEGSMMPGGVDSAPVSTSEPHEPTDAELQGDFAHLDHVAETGGLDLLHELGEGRTVKEVAALIHKIQDGSEADVIVKAISDLAQGVRI
jgi:hypothetical protein